MATIELYKYNKLYTTIDRYPIKNFTIYGERHSGTKWLESTISHTFDIPITWKYGHKHFFGCCNWDLLNRANNTLFIGIVRNIYSWISGMCRIPYHLSSDDIINIKPWQSTKGLTNNQRLCDSHWYTKELYKDIFDMRHNKNIFLYDIMPYLVDNYIFIRYEDFIKYNIEIIKHIEKTYSLRIKHEPAYCADKSKLSISPIRKPNYLNIINQNYIWDYVENRIGYIRINNFADQNYMLYS